MVEPIIYLGIGFLVAALLGLGVMPLVHHRAVRLTVKRLEAATPLSMAEIQADKDQLRAEFAMSARRLEMSVEQLKAKTTTQLAELGKKADAINRLKVELGEKNATLYSLEAREKAVRDQLRVTEEELNGRAQALREAENALVAKQSELGKLNADLTGRTVLAESRQVELAALQAQIDALKLRVVDAEKEVDQTRQRLKSEQAEMAKASEARSEAVTRADNLGARVNELEKQLVAQTREAELLGSRATDLENRLATQGKLLAEREYESNMLRQQASALQKTEADLRATLTTTLADKTSLADQLRSGRTELEQQLQAARDERAKAQRELAAIRQQTESSWASERMENAVLRERINDIAAEVAKLAVSLEGPGSPISVLLATPPGQPVAAGANGSHAPAANGVPVEAQGTLAERIKALQGQASRARQAD
jgi:peptidoglycan hydrolase CwlO-like protein